MTGWGSILVVDDTAESLRILAEILQSEGYRVRPANSGELALASIAAQPPDLILLDIRMPGLDGFEVCRRLKAEEATRKIPVIFQSAATDLTDRLEGLRLGAVDYISKPFQREELVARVRTQLELAHLRGDLEELVRERTAQLEVEIAERKRAEEVLRENEHFLETLLENIPNMLFVKDANTLKFLRFNMAGEKLLGYSRDELLGKNDYDFFPKEQADFFTSKDREIIDNSELLDISEELINTRYLGPRLLHTRKIPIYADDGSPLYLLGISEDITERKLTEEALSSSEAELRTLIHTMTDVIFVTDSEGRYLKIPETNASLLYKPPSELLGKTLHEIFPKDQADFFLSLIRQSLETQKSVNFEYSLSIGNAEIWFTATISPMSEDMTLMVARDITDRKKVEQALQDSRQRMDNIVANSPGAIYRCTNDPEWTMEFLSAAITRITGYPADDFLNNRVRSYVSIIHPEDRHAVEEAVSAGLECKDRYEIDYRLVATDGTSRWVHEQGQGVFAPDGRLLWLDGVIFDITDQRKAEEELRKLNEELEQRVLDRTRELQEVGTDLQESQRALMNIVEGLNEKTAELEEANRELQGLDRLKSLFIASMSHELRTPLNSIIGFSTIVLDEWFGPLNEEQKTKLAIVLRTGKHLLTLINDVIDVSKIEAGKLDTSTDDFNITDLVNEALELMKKDIEDKGLSLEVEVSPITLHSDRRRLFQCLVNLLSNAVKFTEQGGVTIKTSLLSGRALDSGKNRLQISVSDTGIGIHKKDQPRLFTAFSRVDTPMRARQKGTGLGLYLVKKITEEILKGEVGMESIYGKGSYFFIIIPLFRKTAEEKDANRSGS